MTYLIIGGMATCTSQYGLQILTIFLSVFLWWNTNLCDIHLFFDWLWISAAQQTDSDDSEKAEVEVKLLTEKSDTDTPVYEPTTSPNSETRPENKKNTQSCCKFDHHCTLSHIQYLLKAHRNLRWAYFSSRPLLSPFHFIIVWWRSTSVQILGCCVFELISTHSNQSHF